RPTAGGRRRGPLDGVCNRSDSGRGDRSGVGGGARDIISNFLAANLRHTGRNQMSRSSFHWLGRPPAAVVLSLVCASCASNPATSSAVLPLEVPEPPPHEVSPPLVSSETPQAVPAPKLEAPAGTPPPATAPSAATPPVSSPPPSPAAANPVTPPPATQSGGRPPAGAELLPAEAGVPNVSATQVRTVVERVTAKLDTFKRNQLSTGKQADYD